jgi:hypothetical protein
MTDWSGGGKWLATGRLEIRDYGHKRVVVSITRIDFPVSARYTPLRGKSDKAEKLLILRAE